MNAGRVCLAAPRVGFVHGSECRNRRAAADLLSDRVANGEAFAGEFVVRVPHRVQNERLAIAYLRGGSR